MGRSRSNGRETWRADEGPRSSVTAVYDTNRAGATENRVGALGCAAAPRRFVSEVTGCRRHDSSRADGRNGCGRSLPGGGQFARNGAANVINAPRYRGVHVEVESWLTKSGAQSLEACMASEH